MASTILITGANGSLALPAIKHLLTNYATHHAVLTVRNASASDPNTQKLRAIISPFQNRASIRELDLSDLSSVRSFGTALATDITSGSIPPLSSIICNAYYWNLATAPDFTQDGFERTFQINHLSHALLVQQLLESFGPADTSESSPRSGRIVVFGSDAIFPGQNGLEKYPPRLPENLDDLAKPDLGLDKNDYMGHGFHRYALSKLATVTWMYALNKHLQKPENAHLKDITAVAVNPGNLSDSRALRSNTPFMLQFASRFVIRPLGPVLRRMIDPLMRTAETAGKDVIELTVDDRFKGTSGYFTLLEQGEGPPDSVDEDKQAAVWDKTVKWCSQ
ncbi:NAD(P)-binding protein [Penicillium malachiteum]|uniref:3beta-hydroxysteroid 3-dehydrogenase n=1 Tax=Penicillium malachiteum TaxID=1324776 RepID=A0AAD6HA23_9EURO|nr:NAD(P)-binding protein [Penicillium malachiteum]